MTSLYILDGHTPVEAPLFTWAQWMETADRVVAQTTIGDVLVSTVFLGLDHSFGFGPPLFFETLVMGGEHDDEMRRYSTWDEAEVGHSEMVDRLTGAQSALPLDET